MPERKRTIRTFDDFVEETKMLPSLTPVDFSVTDPLEQHFFNVADKHGIIDALLDPFYDEN